MKKVRYVVAALLALATILFVSLDGRSWTNGIVHNGAIPGLHHLRFLGITNSSKSQLPSMDLGKMRRDALSDANAIYLSQQEAPPFDPAFKTPCWWTGKANQRLTCLPYFYLAGFPKSGTTDLYARLMKHPFVVRGLGKEPHHLTRSQFYNKFLNCVPDKLSHASCDITRYARMFFDEAITKIQELDSEKIDWSSYPNMNKEKATHRYPAITVDASASTAWDNSQGHHIIRDVPLPYRVLASNASIIDWIVRMNPDVRFVVIMRDPISRVYSDYNYFASNISAESFDTKVAKCLKTFNDCLESGKSLLDCALLVHNRNMVRIHIGLYHLHLEELLVRIPRERIHFVRSEDYHENMADNLRQIFDFLGLPQLNAVMMSNILKSDQRNVNRKRVDPILEKTWKKLLEFYQPFNAKLARLLNNDAYTWEDVYSKHNTSITV